MPKFTPDPTSPAFVQLLNRVMFDSSLSQGARLLYAALVEHYRPGSPTRPGQARLASMIGCSVRSIRNYLKELTAKGLVTVVKRGCWQNANEYRLHALVAPAAPTTAPESQLEVGADMRKVVSRDTGQRSSYQPYKATNNSYKSFNWNKNKVGEAGAVAFMRRMGLKI